MDKNKAMWEFVSKCPTIPEYLLFNTITELSESTGLIPVSSDSEIESYTDGSCKKEYVFAIVKMVEYEDGTTETNIDSMRDMQGIMDWILEQSDKGVYPYFGPKCVIEDIEAVQNMPDLAGVSSGSIAKLMFQCRVIYQEEK